MGLSLVTMMVIANTLMSSYDFFPLSTLLVSLMYLGLTFLPSSISFPIFFSLGKESDPRVILGFSATFILPHVFLSCDQEYWVMIFVQPVFGTFFGGISPL